MLKISELIKQCHKASQCHVNVWNFKAIVSTNIMLYHVYHRIKSICIEIQFTIYRSTDLLIYGYLWNKISNTIILIKLLNRVESLTRYFDLVLPTLYKFVQCERNHICIRILLTIILFYWSSVVLDVIDGHNLFMIDINKRKE